jgi:hypothetical protein
VDRGSRQRFPSRQRGTFAFDEQCTPMPLCHDDRKFVFADGTACTMYDDGLRPAKHSARKPPRLGSIAETIVGADHDQRGTPALSCETLEVSRAGAALHIDQGDAAGFELAHKVRAVVRTGAISTYDRRIEVG